MDFIELGMAYHICTISGNDVAAVGTCEVGMTLTQHNATH